ncbi:hypothetical protein WN51_13531, partial [Melipona quadrifasciata]
PVLLLLSKYSCLKCKSSSLNVISKMNYQLKLKRRYAEYIRISLNKALLSIMFAKMASASSTAFDT